MVALLEIGFKLQTCASLISHSHITLCIDFLASSTSLHFILCCQKVSALNEAVTGSVKSVFKPWEQRLNSSEVISVKK